MIDERLEELAALYAVDLLDGAERQQFEAALQDDPALQELVRELRGAAASLAATAAVRPPPELRARVLASIGTAERVTSAPPGNVVRPPASAFGRWAPWAIAAGFAAGALGLGQRYLATRSELDLVRSRQELADVALQSARQQLEAERILTARQTAELQQQVASATQAASATREELATAAAQLDESRTQLATARNELAEREARIAALAQRVDTLTGATADIGRQLGEANERIARLTRDMAFERDLANFKITLLASMAKNSPEAQAVAVWDPKQQEGVLQVEKLPALLPNQDYQLWVVDPQYPNPVDGGVFTVDPQTGGTRVTFKARQPVATVAAFAVTLERKGGVPKAEGPFVLLGK